jgi:hypothetical protein
MKKKLVVLLAVVMMFAFSASAYAVTFSDLSDQPATVQDAVAKTVALGIIEGYTDGTFGPDQNITRSEFAKIAVTAAGAKETATILEGNASNFKDVKSGAWYTGWINAAESLGIFLGDGNGNFRPNDTITNQEVITVLLRLLGYNDNLTGTWPVNYVTQANKIEILDDVTIVASAAAKRADVVVMLSATLDQNIVTYDKDTNEFVDKQSGVAESTAKTLLDDSFKGHVTALTTFPSVDQVRDASAKTLNWVIGGTTYIIDADTAVSSNAASIFDLENHQGKVYYVVDGSKLYARYIEVKSYTKTSSDKPVADGDSKLKFGSTSYNAVRTTITTGTGDAAVTTTSVLNNLTAAAAAGTKNSNYIMYFNDDDQIYYVESDTDRVDTTTNKGISYYVKSVGSSSIRALGGVNGATVATKNIKDSDTLIYTDNGFIAPSELKVGDAIQQISTNLFVKVSDATGTLTRVTTGATSSAQAKVIIGGKTYVYGVGTSEPDFYDADFEDVDSEAADVQGNEVTVLVNKDNSVSVIVVGDTSVATKLYGIFVGTSATSTGVGSSSSDTVTFFTAEGKTVEYTIKKDNRTTVLGSSGLNVSGSSSTRYGYAFEYKLNKSGEVTSVTPFTTFATAGAEIEVKNNTYLVSPTLGTFTLASDVVIFEVDNDGTDADPSIVTRASVLNGGDFTPGVVDLSTSGSSTTQYIQYVESTNNAGVVKALAYTSASTTKYHYGVVDAYAYLVDGDPFGLTLTGDDNEYELKNDGSAVTLTTASKAGAFIVYTISGDEINPIFSIPKEDYIYTKKLAVEVSNVSGGQISFSSPVVILDDQKAAKDAGHVGTITANTANSVITDDSTLVYVIDSTGKFTESTMDSVSKNAYVYVPVVNSDGYASVVIVDEYSTYTTAYTSATLDEVKALFPQIPSDEEDA